VPFSTDPMSIEMNEWREVCKFQRGTWMVVLSIIPEIKELFLGTAISGVMKRMLTPKDGEVISERLPSDDAQPAGQHAFEREVLP